MRELEDMGAFEREVLCFCSPNRHRVSQPRDDGDPRIPSPAGTARRLRCNTRCVRRSSRWTGSQWAAAEPGDAARPHLASARDPEDRRPRFRGLRRVAGCSHDAGCVPARGDERLHAGRGAAGAVHRHPAASGWAKRWRANKEKTDRMGGSSRSRVTRVPGAPEDQRATAEIFLVSHHEDPIVKFEPSWRCGAGVAAAPRGRGSRAGCAGVRWAPSPERRVDLKNSTDVVPVCSSRVATTTEPISRGSRRWPSILPTDEQTMMPHRARPARARTGVGHRPGPGRAVAACVRRRCSGNEPVGISDLSGSLTAPPS